MASSAWQPAEGGCPCRNIRYRLEQEPLVVHCCHCTWCQKETGSAFALNAMIESHLVTLISSEKPALNLIPSNSGNGQNMARCPKCHFVLWSNYGGGEKDVLRFVRVGTLDEPHRAPPSLHIFTTTKQPWVVLDDSIPIKEGYYKKEEIWSKANLDRFEKFKSQSG